MTVETALRANNFLLADEIERVKKLRELFQAGRSQDPSPDGESEALDTSLDEPHPFIEVLSPPRSPEERRLNFTPTPLSKSLQILVDDQNTGRLVSYSSLFIDPASPDEQGKRPSRDLITALGGASEELRGAMGDAPLPSPMEVVCVTKNRNKSTKGVSANASDKNANEPGIKLPANASDKNTNEPGIKLLANAHESNVKLSQKAEAKVCSDESAKVLSSEKDTQPSSRGKKAKSAKKAPPESSNANKAPSPIMLGSSPEAASSSPIVLGSSPEPERPIQSEDWHLMITEKAKALMEEKPHLRDIGIIALLRVKLLKLWDERMGVPIVKSLFAARDNPDA